MFLKKKCAFWCLIIDDKLYLDVYLNQSIIFILFTHLKMISFIEFWNLSRTTWSLYISLHLITWSRYLAIVQEISKILWLGCKHFVNCSLILLSQFIDSYSAISHPLSIIIFWVPFLSTIFCVKKCQKNQLYWLMKPKKAAIKLNPSDPSVL